MTDEVNPLTQAVIDGDRDTALRQTQLCLDAGGAPVWIIENRLVPAMAVVGERFKNDETCDQIVKLVREYGTYPLNLPAE